MGGEGAVNGGIGVKWGWDSVQGGGGFNELGRGYIGEAFGVAVIGGGEGGKIDPTVLAKPGEVEGGEVREGGVGGDGGGRGCGVEKRRARASSPAGKLSVDLISPIA